jgi:hypothetical protein
MITPENIGIPGWPGISLCYRHATAGIVRQPRERVLISGVEQLHRRHHASPGRCDAHDRPALKLCRQCYGLAGLIVDVGKTTGGEFARSSYKVIVRDRALETDGVPQVRCEDSGGLGDVQRSNLSIAASGIAGRTNRSSVM